MSILNRSQLWVALGGSLGIGALLIASAATPSLASAGGPPCAFHVTEFTCFICRHCVLVDDSFKCQSQRDILGGVTCLGGHTARCKIQGNQELGIFTWSAECV